MQNGGFSFANVPDELPTVPATRVRVILRLASGLYLSVAETNDITREREIVLHTPRCFTLYSRLRSAPQA